MTLDDYFNLYRQAVRRCELFTGPAATQEEWLARHQAWLDAEALRDLYCSKVKATAA